MNYYKATIQYDGTAYFGFQWQKDIPSIQNEINLALQSLVHGKVTTMGSSRTDSGVHALEQIVKVTCEAEIDCKTFLPELNLTLPAQIRVLSLVPCEGTFKPVSHSKFKEYRYLFTNNRFETGRERFIANNPNELDLELMKKTALTISGKHDFKNFCSTGSNVTTTEREISLSELTSVNPHDVLPQDGLFKLPADLTECFQLRIEGTGFLKQMVRHLQSALCMVGGGKLSEEEFASLLDGPLKTKRLWKVADPRGLYLYRVTYQDLKTDTDQP